MNNRLKNNTNNFSEELISLIKVFSREFKLPELLRISDNTNSLEAAEINRNGEEPLSGNEIDEKIKVDSIIITAKSKLSGDNLHNLLLKLSRFLLEHGRLTISQNIISDLLPSVESDNLNGESHLLIADIYLRETRWDEATESINKAIKYFELCKNNYGLAKCKNLLGVLQGEKGNILAARKYFNECYELIKDDEDEKFIAETVTNIAITENICGNFEKAKEHFYDAAVRFGKVGDLKKTAELRHNMGMLYLEKQNYEQASVEFGIAISAAIKGNYPTVLTISYLGKANALLHLNELEKSYDYCYKALEISIRLEDKLTIADVYRIIGIIERKLKHYDAAAMYLDISYQMNIKNENRLNTAETLLELALMYDETGYDEKKIDCLNKALQYYSEINAQQKINFIENLMQPAES